MKHLYFFAIMLLCANMMCAQDVNTQVATRYQQSGLSMFNELVKDRGDNICFSPLSVQIALSMVQNGADGNTLKQLKQVLGTEEFSNEEIGQYNSSLTKTLTERPQYVEEEWKWYEEANPQEAFDSFYPKCELANGLWTRPDVKLYDDFVQALRTNYDAQVENVSFDTWEGIGKINDWAFYRCYDLVQIYLPNSVTSIGDYAFNNCSGLVSIDIPNSVEYIAIGVFTTRCVSMCLD